MLNSAVTNNKCNILDSCFNLGFDHDEDGNYYHYGNKHYSDNSTNSRKYTDIGTLCIYTVINRTLNMNQCRGKNMLGASILYF